MVKEGYPLSFSKFRVSEHYGMSDTDGHDPLGMEREDVRFLSPYIDILRSKKQSAAGWGWVRSFLDPTLFREPL